MNPTLSARLRDWQRDPYWRVHPPAPWLVAVEPATALRHQGSVPADSQAAATEPAVPHTAGSQTEKAQPAGFQLAVAATAGTPRADRTPADDQLARWQALADQSVVDQAVIGQDVVLQAAGLSREAACSTDVEAAPARSQAALNQGAVTRDEVTDSLGTASALGLAVPDQGQAALSQIQVAQVNQLRQLIGALIFALLSLLEGWQALLQLVQQIGAIWWAPTTAKRAAALQLQPGVAVPIGVSQEASR